MPKVSVIVPTYNRREMVRHAIASVLTQTGVDAELVVVDDGSTDGTADALKELDPALRCIAQPHRGRSAARNLGFKATQGDYVLFLDSDDALMPNGLATLMAVLDARADVDVVHGDGYYCDVHGRRIERVSESLPRPTEPLLDILVLHNVIGPLHGAMTRRRALDRLRPSPFNDDLHGGEDTDLWVRLAAQGSRFCRVDALIGSYTIHDTNASSPFSPHRSDRERSLKRAKLEIHNAPFFRELATATRREFLRQLLTETLAGAIEEQEAVLSAAPFQSLSSRDRSALLRFVGSANAVDDGRFEVGRARLARAVRADTTDIRSMVLLALACCGQWPLRLVVEWRRRRRRRSSVDRSLARHWKPSSS